MSVDRHVMYGLILMVHVLAASVFIGTVFFEVLIMGWVAKSLPHQVLKPVEQVLNRRLFAVMPWVLLLLLLSGLGLLHTHYSVLLVWPYSSFALLLMCKLILVVSVFGHFGLVWHWRKQHRLTQRRSQYLHYSVLMHGMCIAILAKAMFYWTW